MRINESPDCTGFYRRTNQAAHELDDTRQTGGVRCFVKGELLEDVYTFNEFIHDGGQTVFRSRGEIHGAGAAGAPADHRKQRAYVPHQAV